METNRLDGHIPEGPIDGKWNRFKRETRLISPNNRKEFSVLVVGTGLAGAAAAASLAELGYRVKTFCIHDSPRRAHSIAAQGGINAAKNYPNDNDSVWRLFHDTIKGGDFRSREANVYRLAQLSANIIDQCVAQGVPFAREYNGELANRSFGGVQVSRTFYARGQTGQQLLIGAYGALMRQVDLGRVDLYPRREMLDLVVKDGRDVGITVRHLLTGEIEQFSADAVIVATGGYMRSFDNGETILIEPWRAKAFQVVQDLVIDRSSFDRIIAAGSYVAAKSGPHPDGNALPIPKDIADEALDAGACIQCGACVAACPNASAALFTGTQISRLAQLPQGRPEAIRRVGRMVEQMDHEGFGQCTNIGECQSACPKKISINVIATMRREYWKTLFSRRDS